MLSTHLRRILPLLIATGAFAVHAEYLQLPLLGYDGYATILASRIQSPSDFIGTFTELMMDGRFPVGDFYRPMGNLSLAVDYAFWGTQTFGYQLTSMLLWCATIVALYRLTGRLLGGGRAWFGPALAALFFALHPACLSILPYPARRTETLMLLFVALALLAAPRASASEDRRRQLAAGLFALFALASKETGIIAVPLVFLHQLIEVDAHDLRHRLARAISATAPAIVFCGLFLIAHSFVVGGIGGYRIGSEVSYPSKLFDFGPQYLTTTFCSGAFDAAGTRGPLTLAISSALAVMVTWRLLMERREVGDQTACAPRTTLAITLAIVWFAASIGLACTSMQFSPRYVMPMTFSVGLLLGALAEGAARAIPEGQLAQRATAGAALVALAAIVWVGLNGSALHSRYPELRRASRIQGQLLDALTQRIESSDYEYIDVDLNPRERVTARAVDDVWMIAPWSLEAWLELVHPERPYQVSVNVRDPADGYWSLTLNPMQSGRD